MTKLLRCCSCFLLLFCISFFAKAQELKYWIFFTDKDTENYDYRLHLSEEAIEKRTEQGIALVQQTDIPLKVPYIKALQSIGIKVVQQSKWLNAVTASLNKEQIEKIKTLPFVRQVERMNNKFRILSLPNLKDREYALALEQMEAIEMTKAGLNGEGITIGVIDAGFVGASQNEYLQHLFDDKRILLVKDLVNPQRTEHFKFAETSSDNHGNTVLQMICGYEKGGSQYGFATKSKFCLARTDHGDSEFRGEEDYWVAAMEWMDSLGVRIINTSLGYALGFDNPDENYKPEEMDGKTSVISKATQIATEEKGLLVVVSAGNEGNDYNWKVVSTPADSPTVLSVGATQPNGLKAGYSSIGSELVSYLKPNVACFSTNGTSYSAPVITGLAACMMQKNKQAKSKEIFALIEKSSHLYPFGNNYLGYGMPKVTNILKLMEGKLLDNQQTEIQAKQKYVIKLKDQRSKIQVFHKKNATIVIKQDLLSAEKGKCEVLRPETATQTTLVYEDKVVEIKWEGQTRKQAKKAARKAKKVAKKEQKQLKKIKK
jgi:hypothetical protein